MNRKNTTSLYDTTRRCAANPCFSVSVVLQHLWSLRPWPDRCLDLVLRQKMTWASTQVFLTVSNTKDGYIIVDTAMVGTYKYQVLVAGQPPSYYTTVRSFLCLSKLIKLNVSARKTGASSYCLSNVLLLYFTKITSYVTRIASYIVLISVLFLFALPI
jgi:hypothetical protein